MKFSGKLIYRIKKILLVGLILYLVVPVVAFAADEKNIQLEEEKEFFVQEFGLFTGYAQGGLEGKDDYQIMPLILRFGYNLETIEMGFTDLLKPVLNKFDLKPKGYTEFIFEPFLNTVISPDSNLEVGFNILIKFAYPLFDKIHPYGIAGGGVIYISQETNEQGSQYNFIPQVGGGFSYFFKENCAFNLEYRYRHLSNAGLKSPNSGINVDMVLAGLSWFY